MKTDRLLGITVYLLNHKKTSAKKLADHFEVSPRTIQRDIESLCLAGIPVVSTYGADGGYDIMDTFKMERQIAGQNDYTYIVAALQGFVSAYNGQGANEVLEKMQLLSEHDSTDVILDFSVAKENAGISDKLTTIQKGIESGYTTQFYYTNAQNMKKNHEVEPVAAIYKWYGWYLMAYSTVSEDYRLYKLVRMEQLHITENHSTKKHETKIAMELLQKQPDKRTYLDIRLLGKHAIRAKCLEYLNGTIVEELNNGDFIMRLHVPEEEHFWYSSILAFGNQIQIIEPESLRIRICDSCRQILSLYEDV